MNAHIRFDNQNGRKQIDQDLPFSFQTAIEKESREQIKKQIDASEGEQTPATKTVPESEKQLGERWIDRAVAFMIYRWIDPVVPQRGERSMLWRIKIGIDSRGLHLSIPDIAVDIIREDIRGDGKQQQAE